MNLKTSNLKIFPFLFLAVCFLLPFGGTYSQKIKFKKGEVLADEVPFLNYVSRNYGQEVGFSALNSDEEIISIVWFDNQTPKYRDDDYVKLLFPAAGSSLETSLGGGRKAFIKRLLEYEVLNLEGEIDPKKMEAFIEKFDEKITDRTIR